MSIGTVGTPVLIRSTSGSVTGTWGSGGSNAQPRYAGDTLVAIVTAGGTTATVADISTPAGWEQILTIGNNGAATGHAWVAAYWNTAAGGDGAPTFTAGLSGTVVMTCTLFELSAASNFAPVDAYGTYASGSGAGTLSSMSALTGSVITAAGSYAIGAFAQLTATASANTWNASGFPNVVNDGTTGTNASSVLHTAVDAQVPPAAGVDLSDTGHWGTDASAYGAGLVIVFAPQAGGLEAYTNNASTTVTAGGTGAPAAGTPEFWTAGSWTSFPAAQNTAFPQVKFHVNDPAEPSEDITVLNTSTGLVMRGANGTTPVAHSTPFTITNVFTAESNWNLTQAYNVRQYGAAGDGVTDDSAAIQKALTACRVAGGGTVHVPAGTYIIGEILQIGSNTHLKGDGKGVSTIRVIDNMDPLPIGPSPQGPLAGITALQVWNELPASDIAVEDLTFDGNEAGNTSIGGAFTSGLSPCIRLDQVDKLLIRNCEFINSILYNIWLNACTRFAVVNNTILSGQNATLGYNDQDGVHITNSQYGVVQGNIIDTGTNWGVGDDAVFLQSLSSANSGGYGLYGNAAGGGGPNPTSNVAVTGNIIRSAARGCAMACNGPTATVSNVTISGNTIWATLSDGIMLTQDTGGTGGVNRNITIAGNTICNTDNETGGSNAGITLMAPWQQSATGAGWQDVAISDNTFVGFGGVSNDTFIYATMGSGLKITGNIFDTLPAVCAIQIGDNQSSTPYPVTGFVVSGNLISLAASTNADATGILVVDSQTGTIAGNTLTGNGQADSTGIKLYGVSSASVPSGIAVTGNSCKSWGVAIAETTAGGADPNYNLFDGNNAHGNTGFINKLGANSVIGTNIVA